MPADDGGWWYHDNGENMLAGVADDPNNLPRMSDELIVNLLTTIQDARDSFDRIVGNMLPEEQDRLNALRHQGIATHLARDYKKITDDFQRAQNTAGVRTAGPRGGGSWSPPPMREK